MTVSMDVAEATESERATYESATHEVTVHEVTAQDVAVTLEEHPALAPILDQVHFTAAEGIVYLDGHVATPAVRKLIPQQVWTVPGVRGIVNHLVDDEHLAQSITHALQRDQVTGSEHVTVQSTLGAVTLSGSAHSAWRRRRSCEIAQEADGVVSVDATAVAVA
jgi:osmotically-inducible protein OsmY